MTTPRNTHDGVLVRDARDHALHALHLTHERDNGSAPCGLRVSQDVDADCVMVTPFGYGDPRTAIVRRDALEVALRRTDRRIEPWKVWQVVIHRAVGPLGDVGWFWRSFDRGGGKRLGCVCPDGDVPWLEAGLLVLDDVGVVADDFEWGPEAGGILHADSHAVWATRKLR